ncbi:respiratory nitrate reductase subunit gamma [Dehalobacter sp. DCM]|uniref:respiratory nitrate reductase subunit gamma n=1 Tax=Dehalobacter sp. DCM TaxID=2907827 RepID=UPI0030819257|nr:respiratory nitrate reductase subunit gamma [Dehalobacter sp. DCM]
MNILFGVVIPYVVIVLFLVGMILRVIAWLKIPIPFKLTLFPAPKNRGGAAVDLVKESVGFKTLWRGNKNLWFMSWLFHISLAFILIGHFFGIGFLGQQFILFGASSEESMRLSVLFGTYAGVALLLGLMLLAIRRTASPTLRFISSFADYFVLVLLLGIVGSGMYMRLFHEITYEAVQSYLLGLITFHPVPLPDNTAFVFHFTVVQLLLLYFPYSKLVHSCGIFFSRWLIVRPHERQVTLK